jgi:hypothetical protein
LFYIPEARPERHSDAAQPAQVRAAYFNGLQILPHILKGAKVADIMAIHCSIDVIVALWIAEALANQPIRPLNSLDC